MNKLAKGTKSVFTSKRNMLLIIMKLYLENEKANNKFHSSMKFSISQCKICKEAWPLNAKSKLRSPRIR